MRESFCFITCPDGFRCYSPAFNMLPRGIHQAQSHRIPFPALAPGLLDVVLVYQMLGKTSDFIDKDTKRAK